MSKIKRNAGLDNAEYVPAQISNGQIVRVYYYAKDPMNGRLRRVVVKCNRPRLNRDKLIVARQVMMSINEKLARGWNPFVDRMVEDGEVCFGVALEWFLEEKGKELRPDSLRSYRSLVRSCGVGWRARARWIDR